MGYDYDKRMAQERKQVRIAAEMKERQLRENRERREREARRRKNK